MVSDRMSALADFIAEHSGDDPDRLALQKDRWPGIDVAAAAGTLVSRRKLAGKAPLWAGAEGLVMPRTLSAEQCSGEAAARHKAAVISRLWNGLGRGGRKPRIADLTGGLGVDCLEFSRIAEAVLYNDMNPVLAEAAEHNFAVLGAENIEVSCIEASPKSLKDCTLANSDEVHGCPDGAMSRRLERFRPDVVFLDPARRDVCGKKVFLLEDCSPDILALKDRLLEIAPVVMVKLSPMADISMVIGRLGAECAELQIIEAGGECKELLAMLSRGKSLSAGSAADGECVCSVVCPDGASAGGPPCFRFSRSAEASCGISLLASVEEIRPGTLLFEPGKALMKAGCFKLFGEKFGIPLIGRDTHYYIMDGRTNCRMSESAGESGSSAELTGFGKIFRILDLAPMSGKSVRDFGKRHPEAEVTARNVKMTSEELRKRLGVKSSDRFHIFALHVDEGECNMLIFCEKA